jgi:hypothetical protein
MVALLLSSAYHGECHMHITFNVMMRLFLLCFTSFYAYDETCPLSMILFTVL